MEARVAGLGLQGGRTGDAGACCFLSPFLSLISQHESTQTFISDIAGMGLS